MGSRERMIVRIVLWLVERYLREKYKLMTPEDLQVVVKNYLAEMQNLGISFVLTQSKVGEPHEKLSDSDRTQQAEPIQHV
jgi:cytosine/adenosine deaminase-related metal-dependent hydrolase